jgi:hypothetical protein
MVAVLQRDQPCLEGPQHCHGAEEDQRRPQHEMDPDRRRECNLDDRGQTDNDKAEKQDDKNGGAVAGVLGGKIEPAALAARADRQQTGIEAAFAAARTATAKGCAQRRYRRPAVFQRFTVRGRPDAAQPTGPAPPDPSPHQ